MKTALPITALVLGVILVIIAVVLPSGSGDTEFVRLANMVPGEMGEFTYIDVKALQSDEELQSAWESIKYNFVGEDIYGENVSDVTGFGMAGGNIDVILYSGDFNNSRMVSAIEKASVESLQYEGITIWTDAYSYSTAVIDGVVFIGSRDNLQLCIDVAGGKLASLYGDKDAQDIIGRLPDGYILGVAGGESLSGTYAFLAAGVAEYKSGGNTSSVTIFKFEDSDAAREYVTNITSTLPDNTDIQQDGRYATITMTGTSEIPSPEEEAYYSVYDALDYAVYAYYYSNEGTLPTIDGTVNIDGSDFQIIDICDLLTSAGGILSEAPQGVASVDGPGNDNCDSGCTGCSPDGHYVWAVGDYGIYSVCVGDDCEANGEDGFQGVWP